MIPEGYPPLFGGWTPTTAGDLCKGGHPGGRFDDEDGCPHCPRCGRFLDLRPCGCGAEGHQGLSRSFCPTRARWDRQDVSEHLDLFLWRRTTPEAALIAVTTLHYPKRLGDEFRFRPWCEECSQGMTAGGDDPPHPRRVYWPCKTAQALGMFDPLAPQDEVLQSEHS